MTISMYIYYNSIYKADWRTGGGEHEQQDITVSGNYRCDGYRKGMAVAALGLSGMRRKRDVQMRERKEKRGQMKK